MSIEAVHPTTSRIIATHDATPASQRASGYGREMSDRGVTGFGNIETVRVA